MPRHVNSHFKCECPDVVAYVFFFLLTLVFLSIYVGKLTIRSTACHSFVCLLCSALLKLSRFHAMPLNIFIKFCPLNVITHGCDEFFYTSKNVLGEFICYSYS